MRDARSTIGPTAGRAQIARHLEDEYTEAIRDPLWGHVYLSSGLQAVVQSGPFYQLTQIKQLGPTYLVYPGATHTRYAHSIGVAHLAKRIIARLAAAPGAPELSVEGVKSFVAAALLHDVGHFPFTHSFKRLPLLNHEQLTGLIVTDEPLAAILRRRLGVDPAVVAAIVDHTLDDQGIGELRLYRALLSGSLDPDKLDYLNRDAYYCGVPYGVQDIDFALSRIVADGYNGIAIDAAGVSAVENVLFSKYLMYRAVYWHRTVRVATAMIKKAVGLALREGVLQPTELYGLNDQSFMARLATRRFAPFQLVQDVGANRLYQPIAGLPADDPVFLGTHGEAVLADPAVTERAIAAELSSKAGRVVEEHEILIDVPEPVSFEAHFPIIVEGRRSDFSTEGVFTPDVVNRFVRTLRVVRLIVPAALVQHLPHPREFLREVLTDRRARD